MSHRTYRKQESPDQQRNHTQKNQTQRAQDELSGDVAANPQSIQQLQRTLGNQGLQRYLKEGRGLQRTMGDGHDLSSPALAGETTLEAAYDNETLLSRARGSRGEPVRRIQELLLQLGYQLPNFGADSIFGGETESAVRQFQSDHGAMADGIIGPETMGKLDEAAPGTEPPGVEPPGVEPPGVEPPGVEPPGIEPPGVEPPGVEPPGIEPPGVEPPGVEDTPKSRALAKVDEFEADPIAQQAFPLLSKAQIITGLRERIENPESIDQDGLNVCGPASALYILASGNPEGFAHITINLFKFGEVTLNDYTIEPCDDLKAKSPDSYDGQWGEGQKPDQIDWMVLSSMRDSENAIFDYEGAPDEDFSAMTLPGEIEEWMEDLLGLEDVEDETNLFFTKGLSHALEVTNGNLAAGAYVVMFINANMLSAPNGSKKKAGDLFPNHWVVLKAPIVLNGDRVQTRVYSWGGFEDVDCTLDVFESSYYGAVFGK